MVADKTHWRCDVRDVGIERRNGDQHARDLFQRVLLLLVPKAAVRGEERRRRRRRRNKTDERQTNIIARERVSAVIRVKIPCKNEQVK